MLQSFWDHLSSTASSPPCQAQYPSGQSRFRKLIRIHVIPYRIGFDPSAMGSDLEVTVHTSQDMSTVLLFWIMLVSLAKPRTTKTSNGTCICMSTTVTIVLCKMTPLRVALRLLPILTQFHGRSMCKRILLIVPIAAEFLEE